MRARRLRPTFDSLDQRLVLSDTTGGVALASSGIINPVNLIDTTNWYTDGNPPASSISSQTPIPNLIIL